MYSPAEQKGRVGISRNDVFYGAFMGSSQDDARYFRLDNRGAGTEGEYVQDAQPEVIQL